MDLVLHEHVAQSIISMRFFATIKFALAEFGLGCYLTAPPNQKRKYERQTVK